MIVNISPFSNKRIDERDGTVFKSRFSIQDLIRELETSVIQCEKTPLLPSNCVHYISKNHTHIITQEFEPTLLEEIKYTITPRDISCNMYYHAQHYREKCCYYVPDPTSPSGSCKMGGPSCYECPRRGEYPEALELTVEGYKVGDIVTLEHIPLPRMLFTSVLGTFGGSYFVRSTWLHSLLGPLKSPTDSLIPLPIGNVYSDNHICWGDNSFLPSDNIMFLSNIQSRFFETPFNADLDSSDPGGDARFASLFGPSYFSAYNLFTILQGKSTFDPELLTFFERRSLSSGRTYEQLVEFLIRNFTT